MRTEPTPTAKITSIHPDGSTLTDARAKSLPVGATVSDGDRVTHATPDGASGCIGLSAHGVTLHVKTVRAPAPVEPDEAPAAPEPLRTSRRVGIVDAAGPSMGGTMAITPES